MLVELLHVGLVLAVPLPVVPAVDVTRAVALMRVALAADVLHVAGLRLAGLPVSVPLAVVPVCLLNAVHAMVASSVP